MLLLLLLLHVAAGQCDQIGRFVVFGQLLKTNENKKFPQMAHIITQFCQNLSFFSEIILGQIL